MAINTSSINVYNPTGTIIAVSGSVPEGYLPCDGSYVLISEYQNLYNALTDNGTRTNPYGADAGGQFALPDLRGRVPSGGTQNQVGNQFGIGSVGGENVSDLNTNASIIAVEATGNVQSNYKANVSAAIDKGNFSCTLSDSDSHTLTSDNMPAHTHNHYKMVDSGNTCRGNRGISGVNRAYNSRATEAVNYTNTTDNLRLRTQSGSGTQVQLGDDVSRYTGQNAGETFTRNTQNHTIHKARNTTNEVNTARWTNNNRNTALWAEMEPALSRAHSHAVSTSLQSAVYNNGNLAASISGDVQVNIPSVPELTANSAKITYGDLRGKQVLVLYAIKY